MRAPRGRFGEAIWWLVFAGKVAAAGAAALAVGMAFLLAYYAVFGGGVWLNADALFGRRLPRWVAWPLAAGLDGWIAWWIVRIKLEEWRQRRELPDRIRDRALCCPLCKGLLTAWGGAFERCPSEWNPRYGHAPEGCFRLGCEACGREVWFAAWLDGTVRPHIGWLLEHHEWIQDGP